MNNLTAVRRLILYFFLLVFEGALRFWVFPGLSNVLLLVRDPVVCMIYFLAIPAGLMQKSAAVPISVALAIFTLLTSLAVSEAPLLVTIYGFRCNFLHLPLILVMQRALSGADVLRIGRWMMWMMIPMAVLVVRQFRSPIGSLINAGGMPTHYGTVRPAGTFSFVVGMVCFTALVAAFLANSFTRSQKTGTLLKVSCSVAVLSSMAVSGSRSSILAVAIVFVMLSGLSLASTGAARALLALAGVIGLSIAGLSSTEFFEEGQHQLALRFEDSAHGGGVMSTSWERVMGVFDYPIWAAQSASLLGHGLGTGTNVGYFLTTGERGFGGGQETEMGRIMYENGSVIGTIFLLMRFGIALEMLVSGWKASRRGNLLPLLLFGAAGMNVMVGSWGIVNTQGFATFGGGLCLASLKLGLPRRRSVRAPRPAPSLEAVPNTAAAA